jgi:hypothetical protein
MQNADEVTIVGYSTHRTPPSPMAWLLWNGTISIMTRLSGPLHSSTSLPDGGAGRRAEKAEEAAATITSVLRFALPTSSWTQEGEASCALRHRDPLDAPRLVPNFWPDPETLTVLLQPASLRMVKADVRLINVPLIPTQMRCLRPKTSWRFTCRRASLWKDHRVLVPLCGENVQSCLHTILDTVQIHHHLLHSTLVKSKTNTDVF